MYLLCMICARGWQRRVARVCTMLEQINWTFNRRAIILTSYTCIGSIIWYYLVKSLRKYTRRILIIWFCDIFRACVLTFLDFTAIRRCAGCVIDHQNADGNDDEDDDAATWHTPCRYTAYLIPYTCTVVAYYMRRGRPLHSSV